jgi:hypothetical protein
MATSGAGAGSGGGGGGGGDSDDARGVTLGLFDDEEDDW